MLGGKICLEFVIWRFLSLVGLKVFDWILVIREFIMKKCLCVNLMVLGISNKVFFFFFEKVYIIDRDGLRRGFFSFGVVNMF